MSPLPLAARSSLPPPEEPSFVEWGQLLTDLHQARQRIARLEADNTELHARNQQLSPAPSKASTPCGPFGDPTSPSTAPAILHPGVSCDICGVDIIRGARFKCAICHNFDACESCEFARRAPLVGSHHVRGHPMVRFNDSRPFLQSPVTWDRSQFVHRVACHVCFQAPMVGYRYHCECGIDLCETCELMGRHELHHARCKILKPETGEP